MSASAKKLAEKFVGEALQMPPENRPRFFRNVAVGFARLANDPKNVHAKKSLTAIGLEFAGAAQQAATTNDFTQLLHDTAQAWEQLGPDAAMMDASMQVEAIKPSIAHAGIDSNVSIAPASFRSANCTLGRSTQITFAPTAEQVAQGILNQQTVAFWQGNKLESQAMTVDIGTVLLPTIPNPHANPRPSARPFAQILYGADGNTQNTVIVDVALGRRLTVVGNFISVAMGMDPPLTIPGLTQPSPVLTVGASIGAFAAPSQAPVTRSRYIDDLQAAAASPFFEIPLRADMLLLPVPIASPGGVSFGGTIDVFFNDYGGSIIGQWRYDYATGIGLVPAIPVPADAYFCFVRTSVNNTYMRLTFQLSL